MKKPRQVPLHAAPSVKPTNPKDAIGGDKLPLHLWPATASALGCLALLDGALKYGRSNFRAVGVRFSIYYDALMRHMMAFGEGEDCDPDSGLPHEAHALACLAILVDAKAAGKLTDDRQYPGGYRTLVEDMTSHVTRLKALRAGLSPTHYTITEGGLHGGRVGTDQSAECAKTLARGTRRAPRRGAVSRRRPPLTSRTPRARRAARPLAGGSREQSRRRTH